MSTAQHTPGSWKVFPVFADAEIRAEDGTLIAVVPGGPAVPDLIDAARRLERRGFFAPSTCADDETAADMALMRSALARTEGVASS